ncbi:ESPR-type extended signal peptide-containing protein, partial [Gallibacterium sp. AGMB14963]|uniref:ESPR-type extended signal peptide-containing protein n=1 Tax=Gallibacterium faecale TaxID=3019086 RepID=UPI0022F16F5B
MNHIFRIIFDKTKGVFVVVSELTKSHGKAKSEKQGAFQVVRNTVGGEGTSLNDSSIRLFKLSSIGLATLVAIGGLNPFVAHAKVYDVGVYACDGRISPDDPKIANGVKTDTCSLPEGVVALNLFDSTDNWVGIDPGAVKSVAIGNKAVVLGSQATAVGSRSLAHTQATAVGNDVYALGGSSIAIGNDDLYGHDDKLPVPVIMNVYQGLYASPLSGNGYGTDSGGNPIPAVESKGWLPYNDFKDLYISNNLDGHDTRNYSPTYAARTGAIAIGSRTVAGGTASTALGSLSFALADYSTAMGMRTFIDAKAVGATAIGEKVRAYSANSIAVGNQTETTEKGTFAYGYQAKAVGQGSLAFGYATVAGAYIRQAHYDKLKNDLKTIHDIQVVNSDGSINKTNQTDYINKVNTLTTELDGLFEDNKLFAQKGRDGRFRKTKNNDQTSIKDGTGEYLNDGNEYMEISGKPIYAIQSADGDLQTPGMQWAKNSLAMGRYAFALRDNSVAVGYNSVSDASSGIAIGSYSYVSDSAPSSVAIGVNSYVNGANSVAMGYSAKTSADNSLVFGMGAKAGGFLSIDEGNALIAKGYRVISSTQAQSGQFDQKFPTLIRLYDNSGFQYLARNSSAIGVMSEATAFNSMAIGNNSKATLNNSLALGYESVTDYDVEDLGKPGWVAPGAISIPTSAATGVVSVGRTNQERRITNVASGYLDNDAVNVAQLRSLNDRISSVIGTSNSSSLFQYLSIESQNGEAAKLSRIVNKKREYTDYVSLRRQYLGLVAREKYNGEDIDDNALNKIKSELQSIEASHQTFKTTSAKLNKIATDLDSAPTAVNKDKLEASLKQLETAFKTDSADNVVNSVLSQEETRLLALQDTTNFKNDGARGKDSIAIGWKATTGERDTNGAYKTGGKVGDLAVAIGYEATATGSDAIAIGTKNTVGGSKSIAIGYGHKVTGNNSGTLGDPNTIYFDNSYILGNHSTIGDKDTPAVTETGSFVVGNHVNVTADKVFVLGSGTENSKLNASLANSVYLGHGSAKVSAGKGSRNLGTAYTPTLWSKAYSGSKAFAGNNPTSIVTIGSDGNSRLLQGVAAGTISKESTDAINGSQLFAVVDSLQADIANAAQNASGSVNFTGDNTAEKVNLQLGQTLKIYGDAASTTDLSTGNIKVTGSNGSLLIQLAKTISGLTEVNTSTLRLGTGGPSLTASNQNINVNGAKLVGLTPGVNPTDAVTVRQLNTGLSGKADKAIVTQLQNNTIKLVGDADAGTVSNARVLASQGGISFDVLGDEKDVTVKTTADGLNISLTEETANKLAGLSDDGKLRYKVSNDGQETVGTPVGLATGLDFTGDKNITTGVGQNGEVSFALKNVLTGLESATFTKAPGADGSAGTETVIDGNGVAVTPLKDDGTGTGNLVPDDSKDPVTLTSEGLDNGGNPLKNVGDATEAGDAVNKGQLDAVAAQLGLATNGKDGINGVDGYDGAAGAAGATVTTNDGTKGIPGDPGNTGAQGPAGKDGLNGTTTVNKVQALRDGVAGSTVYTDERR